MEKRAAAAASSSSTSVNVTAPIQSPKSLSKSIHTTLQTLKERSKAAATAKTAVSTARESGGIDAAQMRARGLNPLTGLPMAALSTTDPLAIQQQPQGYSRYDQEKFREKKNLNVSNRWRWKS